MYEHYNSGLSYVLMLTMPALSDFPAPKFLTLSSPSLGCRWRSPRKVLQAGTDFGKNAVSEHGTAGKALIQHRTIPSSAEVPGRCGSSRTTAFSCIAMYKKHPDTSARGSLS